MLGQQVRYQIQVFVSKRVYQYNKTTLSKRTTTASVPKNFVDRSAITIRLLSISTLVSRHNFPFLFSNHCIVYRQHHMSSDWKPFTAVENYAPERWTLTASTTVPAEMLLSAALSTVAQMVFSSSHRPLSSLATAPRASLFPKPCRNVSLANTLMRWWSLSLYITATLLYVILTQLPTENEQVEYFKSNSTSHATILIKQSCELEWAACYFVTR